MKRRMRPWENKLQITAKEDAEKQVVVDAMARLAMRIGTLEIALHAVIDAPDLQAAKRIAVDVVGTSSCG